jgi:hypothetical protein
LRGYRFDSKKNSSIITFGIIVRWNAYYTGFGTFNRVCNCFIREFGKHHKYNYGR